MLCGFVVKTHAGDGVPSVVCAALCRDGRRADTCDTAGQVVDGVFAIGHCAKLIELIFADRPDINGLHLVFALVEDDVE